MKKVRISKRLLNELFKVGSKMNGATIIEGLPDECELVWSNVTGDTLELFFSDKSDFNEDVTVVLHKDKKNIPCAPNPKNNDPAYRETR